MKLSNETYDTLRFICDRLLPALGTLYFAISQFVPVPYPEAVVGIITALVCFGDELLNASKKRYAAQFQPQESFAEEEKYIEQEQFNDSEVK